MYIKRFTLTAFLIAFFTLSFANTMYYRLSYRDDPATTITIGWSDSLTSSNASVYFGTTDFGTNYLSYPSTKSIDRTVNYKGLNNQFARLTGLLPNTVYYFVIKDNESTSKRMIFKTLPDNANTPITFIAGGDSRTGSFIESGSSLCRPNRQEANKLVAKIRPSFVAFSGDYVYSIPDLGVAATNAAWADWFADWQLTTTPDKQLIPIVPVFGNHELTADVYNMFDIPNSNTYYSLAIGGNLLRLYTLNTELNCDATQQSWLANDLQLHTGNSNEPYWKFAQYHYPFVPHSNYAPNTTMITCWANLFETNKVRLVSEAHAHIMKVTWPIHTSTATGSDNGFIRNDSAGIVYIGEGSWGAPMRDLYTYFSPTAAFNWTRNQEKIPGFHVICVSKQTIEVRTAKFENVANVSQIQLTDAPCTLPTNIVLWSPSNGSVVTLNNPAALSNDATLSNLTPSAGSLVPTFASLTTDYTVELPVGTVATPSVSATPTHPNATKQITQATNINGTLAERTATILVTAEDGITTKTYTVQFALATTGFKDISAGKSAVVYPNPSTGVFYFDFFEKQNTLEIEVYSSLGRHIKSERILANKQYKLNLSEESSGVYFVYIKNGTNVDMFRLIVDRKL
ncbi:MAG: T9SS type A sorting domain-containing protein [Bacteroidota bacterium]